MNLEITNPGRVPSDFSIFYCWQDHLDSALHRNLIQNCLSKAIGIVQSEIPEGLECTLRLDHATEGRAGAVDIANSILEKIRASAMVVADVTPSKTNGDDPKFYPNPNVMLEVGYAAMAKGWNRVNCVFNSASVKPEEMPFDLRYRRLSPYKCEDRDGRKEASGQLTKLLVSAIRTTLLSIDAGEIDETLGDSKLQHERDLRVVLEMMRAIHRPTIETFIEMGQSRQSLYICIFYWTSFNAFVRSSFCMLYDKELQGLANRLDEVWGAAIHCGGKAFFPGDRPGTFHLKASHLWDESYKKTIQEMETAFNEMPIALNNLLSHIHKHFTEVDMDKTDQEALERHREWIE